MNASMLSALHLNLMLVICTVVTCALAATNPVSAETSTQHLSLGGLDRSFVLSRPASREPRPAVIVLHGGTLDAENAMRTTGMEPLVAREQLVAAYPNAIAGNWNDGRVSGSQRRTGSDDVAFLRTLVEGLVRDGIADPRRIYATGPSNGGMMTLRLVCEAADLFAAAAPIIANLPADLAPTCKPTRPIPILVMNGTADPLVPFAGGAVGFRGERGRVLSTDETVALLRRANGCAGDADLTRLPDVNPDDGSSVTVERWTQCSTGAPVVLYRIDGGGHRIPRLHERPRPVIDRLLGRANHDFEAADTIWEFFKDKKR